MNRWKRGTLAAAAAGAMLAALVAPSAAMAVAPAEESPASTVAAAPQQRATNKAIDVRRMIDVSLKDAQQTNLKRVFDAPKAWKVARVTVAEADGSVDGSGGALKPKDFSTWLVGIAVVFKQGRDVAAVYTIGYTWENGRLTDRMYLKDPIFEDLWMDTAPTHNLSWAMKTAQAFMVDNPDLFDGVVPIYNGVVRNPLGMTLTTDYQWIFGTFNIDDQQTFLLVNDTTGEVQYEVED